MKNPIPPYSEEAEKAVLECMRNNPEAQKYAREHLTEDSFYLEYHQIQFKYLGAEEIPPP